MQLAYYLGHDLEYGLRGFPSPLASGSCGVQLSVRPRGTEKFRSGFSFPSLFPFSKISIGNFSCRCPRDSPGDEALGWRVVRL